MTPRNKPATEAPERQSTTPSKRVADFSLGELLERRREELGITIKQAEKETKIRSEYLQNIEAGAFDKLPDDIYTRGYVKNYADFLGFETTPLLNLYKKERQAFVQRRGPSKAKVNNQSLGLKPLDTPRFVVTPRSLLVLLGIALVGLIIGYIAWQLSVLSAPPKLTVDNKEGSTVTTNIVYITGKTDESADLFINDAQVATAADGAFREKVTLVDGPNQVKVTARSRLNKSTTVVRTINARLPKEDAVIGATSAVAGGVELVVRVGPDAANISVNADGKDIFSGTMTAGSEQTFRASDTIKLSTSNASSTQLILSNTVVTKKDLGKVGTSAEPKNDLIFSKDTKVE